MSDLGELARQQGASVLDPVHDRRPRPLRLWALRLAVILGALAAAVGVWLAFCALVSWTLLP